MTDHKKPKRTIRDILNDVFKPYSVVGRGADLSDVLDEIYGEGEATSCEATEKLRLSKYDLSASSYGKKGGVTIY